MDGDRVGAEPVEGGGDVAGVGRADVAALGVEDHGGAGSRRADRRDRLVQGAEAVLPQRLVEGRVGLVGAGQLGRRLDDRPVELDHPLDRRRARRHRRRDPRRVRVEPHDQVPPRRKVRRQQLSAGVGPVHAGSVYLAPRLLLAEELQEGEAGQVVEEKAGALGAAGGELDAERFLDRADDEAGGHRAGVGAGAGLLARGLERGGERARRPPGV